MENPIFVKVTNEHDQPIMDRAFGKLYTIPARGSLNLPLDAACHIFGVNFAPDVGEWSREAIYDFLCRRWGWNRPEMREKGPRLFSKIQFEMVEMEQREKPLQKSDVLAEARTPKAPQSASGFIKATAGTEVA